jgi:hypothetical protein
MEVRLSHRYVPLYRPAHWSTLPRDVNFVLVEAEHANAHLKPNLPRSKYTFGVIKTNRELLPVECEIYQLKPVEGIDQNGNVPETEGALHSTTA